MQTNIIPIALASDENYASYMYVTIYSALKNRKTNVFYDFYLLIPSGFSKKTKDIYDTLYKKFNNIKINFIDMKDRFCDQKQMISHITFPAYYRLALAELLPQYEKILYFDCDTIINKDLTQFYNINLENNYIAGVKAAGFIIEAQKNPKLIEEREMKNCENYINSGVTLWNLKKIREDKFSNKLYELAKNNYPIIDQDVVNIAFEGKIKILSLKHNFMTKYFPYNETNQNFNKIRDIYQEKNINDALQNPIIVHYADKIKPWNDDKIYLANLWWKYAKQTPYIKSFKKELKEKNKLKMNNLRKQKMNEIKKILQNILSIKNETKNKNTHKILTLLGIKFKFKQKQKALVLVGPLAVGDFYFVNPFFKYIKQSPKYKNHKIIYFALDAYLDYAKQLNEGVINEFYSLDKILTNKKYKNYVFSELKKYKINTITKLTYTELSDNTVINIDIEKLISSIKAKEKFANILIIKEVDLPKDIDHYSNIIYSPNEFLFESERRKHFFENWLEIEIEDYKFKIDTDILNIDNNCVAISALAGNKTRMLEFQKWLEIINFILKTTDNKILLIGSKKSQKYYEEILSEIEQKERCIILSGKTSLDSLPIILSKCKLLISAETSTVHLANYVGVKTLCISNGSYYGRFQPYNSENIEYIYPEIFYEKMEKGKIDLQELYGGKNLFDINEIDNNTILKAIEKKLI